MTSPSMAVSARRLVWALRAESRKLASRRSTYLVMVVVLALGVGVGLLDLSSLGHNWATMSAADRAAADPVSQSFSGLEFAELALGGLGVLAISPEYSSGMIRTTFCAIPSRSRVFVAKALVLTTLVTLVGELVAFTCYLAGRAVLSGRVPAPGIADAATLRAVLCAGLYLTVVTLVGLGLGAALRHTAAAMCALVGLVFLAWPLARAVEGFSYLPDRLLLVNAADVLTATHPVIGPHAARVPSLAMAYLDLALYLAVFLGLGAWRMHQDPGT
jgi:ABC-2 type transport system permease protein